MSYATLIEQRIYVACLASYNAGILHGEWISCNQSGDDIRKEIADMLAQSPSADAEEWAIHDYEGFYGYRVTEWHDLEELSDVARILSSQEYDPELIISVYHHMDYDDNLEAAIDYLEENYVGHGDTLEEWCENFLDDIGELESIPTSLRRYIDFASYAKDMEYSGDIFTVCAKGQVHVLWNR